MKKVCILSLPGGGIKGIVQATILAYIERLLKQDNPNAKLIEYFDFVAGTSIGGVAIGLYNTGKYSGDEILDMLVANAQSIFKRNWWERIKDGGGLWNEQYSAVPFYKLLQQYFGDMLLSSCIKPCLITAYDMENRDAYFFKSHKAIDDSSRDFLMCDVARATSAAPTKWEPLQTNSLLGERKVFCDGGLHCNNPAMCALIEAGKLSFGHDKEDYPTADNVLMLSLGTGGTRQPYEFSKYKNAGIFTWLPTVLDIAMSGNSDTVRHQLKWMFEYAPNQLFQDVVPLACASSSFTNSSLNNIKALQYAGQKFISDNRGYIEQLTNSLSENK